MGRGAWIWHDEKWQNVVGEDTERFVIRGSAEKAVTPLAEDLLGKPISSKSRPTPAPIQWNEPSLVVDRGGRETVACYYSYRFQTVGTGEQIKNGLLDSVRLVYGSDMFFVTGRTTLDMALAYVRDDWRHERKLLGSDGYYHITFADSLKGATIPVDALIGVDEGQRIVIEGAGVTLDAQGATGLFLVEGSELILKDLTLKGARADGPIPYRVTISANESSLMAYSEWSEHSSLENSVYAGALKASQDRLLEKSLRYAYESLGGIGNYLGELHLDLFSPDLTFRGAAVQVIEDDVSGKPGIVTIENCRIEDCLAKEGGAIYLENNGCSVTVRNSSFVQCGVCDAASGKGGAIAAAGTAGPCGKLTLQDVVFAECGGGETFNDVINLGAAFEADMTGVVMSGGAHGGIYVASGAALTLNNSVIAGNGGYDFAGTLADVLGSNVYYGSRMGELWGGRLHAGQ